jgi:hypothetical protein
MDYGRLIRVSKFQGDPRPIAYIVAVKDAARAIQLLEAQIATRGTFEDLGRVSDALLMTLELSPGQFACIDELPR